MEKTVVKETAPAGVPMKKGYASLSEEEAASWHCFETEDVQRGMNTARDRGLTTAEAQQRLAQHGANELNEQKVKSPLALLWEQLTETMVLLLVAAGSISALMGDTLDAAAIWVIVVLNAAAGFVLQYRAEKAIAALKKLAVPAVRVRRDGQTTELSTTRLVPGDVVLLEAGQIVPADCRLLESANLRTQEAILTGEANAVDKHTAALKDSHLPLGDRKNMVYSGTTITYGRGIGVVTATGMHTELGRIAALMQHTRQEPTPLQKQLSAFGKSLAVGALLLVGLMFVLGLLRGEPLRTLFFTSVSMAVAVVPEGLPAVITIALALGSQRMLARHVLIRKLPAVETLGSITVICSDKTGTLTQNRMTAATLEIANRRVDLVSGDRMAIPEWELLLAGGALCNDAQAASEEGGQFWGEPTETALAATAWNAGLVKANLEQVFPRIDEMPFDSERKRMTTVHSLTSSFEDGNKSVWQAGQSLGGGTALSFTKGAVESVMAICTLVWDNGQVEPLDTHWSHRISQSGEQLAQEGMRVLGIAFRPLKEPSAQSAAEWEQEMIFVGMVGLTDPHRPEAEAAVKQCRQAGIRPILITGDHPLTAQSVAQKLGFGKEDGVLMGAELDQLSEEELIAAVEKTSVYARVSPEHKLRIVQALQQQGHCVAMSGDGVNDAPALKKADIGVAMGVQGTDVAKEAADMVLQDDNFASIVAAVEEGRVIHDNMRKFIRYLLGCN